MYLTTAERTYAVDAASCQLRWKHIYEYRPRPDFDLKVNRGVAYAGGRLFRGTNDGRLLALDARTGEELWNVVAGDVTKGETFPAAPIAWRDLVFIGNAGGDNFGVIGRMMAFDARTGAVRWRYPTGQPIGGGVVTYRAANRQLVAVAAGMHAPVTWKLKSPPAKVLVFGLP